MDPLQSLVAPHGADLFHSLCAERITDKSKLRIENRIHLAGSKFMLNFHIGNRQHAAGKILRRSNGALHGICIEAELFLFGQIVFRHKIPGNKPLTEI